MTPCDGAPILRQCELCPLGVAMQQVPSLNLGERVLTIFDLPWGFQGG